MSEEDRAQELTLINSILGRAEVIAPSQVTKHNRAFYGFLRDEIKECNRWRTIMLRGARRDDVAEKRHRATKIFLSDESVLYQVKEAISLTQSFGRSEETHAGYLFYKFVKARSPLPDKERVALRRAVNRILKEGARPDIMRKGPRRLVAWFLRLVTE